MSQLTLTSYDLKVLRLAAKNKFLKRGLLGWPSGSAHGALEIQGLIDAGYLKFYYDWGYDRPCIKITALGRCRLEEAEGEFEAKAA